MADKECGGYWLNFDWVTGEVLIDWIFGYEHDGVLTPGGPWWKCISCDEIFHSATMCTCDECNPFSGYCRKC